MLLGDLLESRVLTPDGRSLGRVVDVRFRRGPRHDHHEGELTLVALLVSPRTRQPFFGYERGTVTRPAVVAAVVRWLHRGSRIVPWETVARVERGTVHLAVDPPVIPLAPPRTAGDPRRAR